ncbi:MAG: hypothetical protein KDA78_04630 [Planctomycetaceae bacterium]|nr:hypothetical protein [Planctomycetaceae bacterium]
MKNGYGTIVGNAVELVALVQQTNATLNVDRSCVIMLENQLNVKLTDPKYYEYSGFIKGVPVEIGAKPDEGKALQLLVSRRRQVLQPEQLESSATKLRA